MCNLQLQTLCPENPPANGARTAVHRAGQKPFLHSLTVYFSHLQQATPPQIHKYVYTVYACMAARMALANSNQFEFPMQVPNCGLPGWCTLAYSHHPARDHIRRYSGGRASRYANQSIPAPNSKHFTRLTHSRVLIFCKCQAQGCLTVLADIAV